MLVSCGIDIGNKTLIDLWGWCRSINNTLYLSIKHQRALFMGILRLWEDVHIFKFLNMTKIKNYFQAYLNHNGNYIKQKWPGTFWGIQVERFCTNSSTTIIGAINVNYSFDSTVRYFKCNIPAGSWKSYPADRNFNFQRHTGIGWILGTICQTVRQRPGPDPGPTGIWTGVILLEQAPLKYVSQ